MTGKERIDAAARVAKYDRLSAALTQLDEMISMFNREVFTGNTSRVQFVTGITVRFKGEIIDLSTDLFQLPGFDAKAALLPLLEKYRDRLWKEREAT